MKIIRYFLLFCLFTIQDIQAQNILIEAPKEQTYSNADPSQVIHYTLENGLEVYLNADKNMNKVTGAFVIKGGAKNDPKDATGIAHYLEHMLFKGTQNIGTRDFTTEKLWLDSVKMMYDMLAYTKGDTAYRNRVLKKIDSYSQEANKYAIPGEFDQLISVIGGTGLNAYTDYEKIVYHNSFPKENMDKWLSLYRERFDHAVFRLFQGELESVFEEKNMSLDNTFRRAFEAVSAELFPNTIYGEQTVLGSVEHLKNPSISKMETYFKSYYQANNMALVLVGNFNIKETKDLIHTYFKDFRDGEKIPLPQEKPTKFNGRKQVTKHLTPLPAGVLGFHGPADFDPDKVKLELVLAMLNNQNETGLLDSLMQNNALMLAMNIGYYNSDIGGIIIAYVPKIPFHGLKSGENLIWKQLEKLKNGNFSDALFQAVKRAKIMEFDANLESSGFRMQKIANAYVAGKSWNDYYESKKILENITKKEVQNIAQKYFTKDYLAFYSKIGFPKVEKLQKPNFTAFHKEKETNSLYFNNFLSKEFKAIQPNTLKEGKDYLKEELQKEIPIYYVHNPYNNIYSYEIKIYCTSDDIKGLNEAIDYLAYCGTNSLSRDAFQKKLQTLGTSIYTKNSGTSISIGMKGDEQNFEPSLKLFYQWILTPEHSKLAIKNLVKNRKLENRIMNRDISSQAGILQEYLLYGSQSSYLNRVSLKELKKSKPQDYIEKIQKALKYRTSLFYVGKTNINEVKSQLEKVHPIIKNNNYQQMPQIRPLSSIKENEMFFIPNKKSIQSHIRFVFPTNPLDLSERITQRAFNSYFGTGLNSRVFREIREYRSLAYSAWAYLGNDYNISYPSFFIAGTSTQNDKSLEAIQTFENLIQNASIENTQANIVKLQLENSINTTGPNFRNAAQYIAYWNLRGYTKDPRNDFLKMYHQLSPMEIQNFQSKNVSGHNMKLGIIGNPKIIPLDDLKKDYNFHEMKIKKLYKK